MAAHFLYSYLISVGLLLVLFHGECDVENQIIRAYTQELIPSVGGLLKIQYSNDIKDIVYAILIAFY